MNGRARPRHPDSAAVGSPARIENYVSIGSRLTILPGVSMGEGGVVGAGTVVAKDIFAWADVIRKSTKVVRERSRVRYTLSQRTRVLLL